MKRLVGVVCMCLTVGVASAGNVGMTAKVGTLGLGADITCGLGMEWNARVGLNAMNYGSDLDMDIGDVDGDLSLLTIPFMLDWHPSGGSYRFTGGVIINNNEVELTAGPGEVLEFNGRRYEVDDFDGLVSFSEVAFYVGVGYGNAVSVKSRWHFAADIGLMFHGTPDATASAVAAIPSQQTSLDADLAVEVNELNDDISGFIFYPVVSVGVSYTF